MRFTVCHEGKQCRYSVARFVLECYEGLSSIEVDHINRVRSDNRLCNLRYVTREESMQNTNRGASILVYDIVTDEFATYDSIREFSNMFELNYDSVCKAISENVFTQNVLQYQNCTRNGCFLFALRRYDLRSTAF